ncbi:hypothetical protein ACHAW5_008427 [Stephanodiscus triporus]|uniref:Mitochondrial splicing suppressor 51-like C-terminal domain-containing protein n=1 Tax=Stephanodiscus triporus TaxID=2934178 RepID=A0ABD3PJA4_9STRA
MCSYEEGRSDPINDENNATAGGDGEDIDGSSNASENEDRDGVGGERFMEGYTPLNFNMNELVLMHDSDSESNENVYNDDEEMDDNLFANGHYHMIGAPPRRLNGVRDGVLGRPMPHAHDENDEPPANGSPESVEVPVDFHILADRALRGLEDDHTSTLERSTDADPYDVTSDDRSTGNVNAGTPHSAEFLDDLSGGANMPFDDQIIADSSFTFTDSAAPAAAIALSLGDEISIKSKPVDVGAIEKALQSIRLKSPHLATHLDAGASSSFSASAAHAATDEALNSVIDATSWATEHSLQQQYTSHRIIPAGPLAAFRRTTLKAQAASANLTRSATLSEAVLRLWPLICFRKKMEVIGLGRLPQQQANLYSKTLTIHILGADSVECASAESVRKSVGPFVRWMDAALHSGALRDSKVNETTTRPELIEIDSLLIEFSGPNIPSVMVGDLLDLLSHSNAPSVRLTSAKAIFHQRQYHEVRCCLGENDTPSVDIAVAFNAGIWGYESWKPTISSMIDTSSSDKGTSSRIGKTIFVITAYTMEECEDDADVVTNVVEEILASKKNNAGLIARQLWIEANRFSSRCERITASAPPGRKYFENGAWQAWLLG